MAEALAHPGKALAVCIRRGVCKRLVDSRVGVQQLAHFASDFCRVDNAVSLAG